MKKKLLAIAIVLGTVTVSGCQVPPPTSSVVQLTWIAPLAVPGGWTGCTTTAPCVYGIYRCTVSASTCASTSNVAWSEITTPASRPSGTSYTDSNASGMTAYYVAVTFQGTNRSPASNMAGPLAVPATPLPPALGPGTLAANDLKPIPPATATESLASLDMPTGLTAKVRR